MMIAYITFFAGPQPWGVGDIGCVSDFLSIPRFSSAIELVLEEFPEPVKTAVTPAAFLLCIAEDSDSYIWLWIALDMILKNEFHYEHII